jgi:hypothetical protein
MAALFHSASDLVANADPVKVDRQIPTSNSEINDCFCEGMNSSLKKN